MEELKAAGEHTPEAFTEAVKKYEEEMWVRGHETVKASIETAYDLSDWNKVKDSTLFTMSMDERVA